MEKLISIVGIIVPMMTIAGSAVAFVWKAFKDSHENSRKKFFELMSIIDENGSIASKISAVYQLRYFPEHADFIIRFCNTQKYNISGGNTSVRLLSEEMENTREFLLKKKKLLK